MLVSEVSKANSHFSHKLSRTHFYEEHYNSSESAGINRSKMSVGCNGGRNLLKNSMDNEKRVDNCTLRNRSSGSTGTDEPPKDTGTRKVSKNSSTNGSMTSSSPPSSSPLSTAATVSGQTLLTCFSDENRNSIIEPPVELDVNVCEVTTTEITERKTKKKTSAIHTIRNFVRATVVPSTHSDTESQDNLDFDDIDNNKGTRKKKTSLTKHRMKKRVRRSREIHNAGASLWKPMDNCCWKSAAGRLVYLEDIPISDLCELELSALKQSCLQSLRERNLDCQISIPKENHVARRRRLKQILLGKKNKEKVDNQDKEIKPQNPVFSIDLYQVIENDKAVNKAHEIALEKLGAINENENTVTKFDQLVNQNDENGDFNNKYSNLPDCEDSNSIASSSTSYLDRRNSDPTILDRNLSFSNTTEYDDKEMPHYMRNLYIRKIDTLKEEDEEDLSYPRRRSRLIEALTLSSTSASSTCVLNKESEFTPSSPQVPKVMIQTAEYITKYALNTAGIFRTGGSKKRVNKMREDFDNGYTCVVTEESNPHDVAALFKEFLRSLPDPLLTRELYSAYLAAARQKDQQSTNDILTDLVRLLPSANRDTLEVTLKCLRKVADNAMDRVDADGNLVSGNKMDAKNLATLMAPNILHRCKTYKTSTAYQADTSLNPEDNKAAIDVVFFMIYLNEDLFKIPASVHDHILRSLLEEEPELVDYVLKKKAARSSLTESILCDEISIKPQTAGRRPSSAGPRTRYSLEEVSFQKSNSFNQGPYKPFIRRRKESTGSRPSSSRSDPADRISVRASGFTPPNSDKNKRRSSKDISEHDAAGSRDSGVVLNSTPPFQRNSAIRSSREYGKISPMHSPPCPSNIVYRKHSRDRESRDSAYESGVKEMLPSRKSNPPISIHLNNDPDILLHGGGSHQNSPKLQLKRTSNSSPIPSSCVEATPKIDLNDVLNEPSFLPIPNNVKTRKISLPVMCHTKDVNLAPKSPVKSNSMDSDLLSPISPSIDWDYNPEWSINVRDSQFPSQETTL